MPARIAPIIEASWPEAGRQAARSSEEQQGWTTCTRIGNCNALRDFLAAIRDGRMTALLIDHVTRNDGRGMRFGPSAPKEIRS